MTKEELFTLVIPEPDKEAQKAAKERFDSLAKPLDGLGTFEDMICRIAAVQGKVMPDISKRALVIMCADNGVVAEGVSQTGPEVTAKVAALMAENASSAGIMAQHMSVDIIPVDVGIDSDEVIPGLINRKIRKGTGNIAHARAMSEDECLSAIGVGIDIAADCRKKGIKLIATGEMGIGNTTTATALLCALTGSAVSEVVGRGAGLCDEGLERKTCVIERALKTHDKINNTCKITPSKQCVLDAVGSLGGLDIAAIAGVYIGSAMHGITTVVDGLISAVSALSAEYICPGVKRYMLASHRGREKGCELALKPLGLKSVLDADMALGEGTGAIMLFPLLDMVMSLYREGTSFADTDIQKYERFDV